MRFVCESSQDSPQLGATTEVFIHAPTTTSGSTRTSLVVKLQFAQRGLLEIQCPFPLVIGIVILI